MTAPALFAALRWRDLESHLAHCEHLAREDSPLYRAGDHDAARVALCEFLLDLIHVGGLRLAELSPPPAAGQGDAPPPAERPVPKIVSDNVHG